MLTVSDQLNINYTKFNLTNGIKCVLYPRKEIHSVNIKVLANVGMLDENTDTNGISHFLEHVTMNGTEEMPNWEDLDNFLNECSGSTNAYTSFDHTMFHGTFPFQYLEKAIYYFSQIVLHPLIKDSDVQKERTIILDESTRYEDNVNFKLYQNMQRMRFAEENSPYKFDIIGTQKNISELTQEKIKKFYERFYIPENIEIYVVGNFEIDQIKKLLEKYFVNSINGRTYDRKPERNFKKQYPTYSKFDVKAVQKLDIDQYYLTATFPSYEFALTKVEDRYKVGFLKSMTASSSYFQSVLWKRLREELNLVYGVSAFGYNMYARDVFGVQTSFAKEHLETVLKEIYEGLNNIKENHITDIVFKARQKKLLDTQLMQLDDPGNILDWIIDYEDEFAVHGRGLTPKDYLEYIKELQFLDTVAISTDIFNWQNLNIGLVTSEHSTEIEQKVRDLWQNITKNK